jgi:hypothetical protein
VRKTLGEIAIHHVTINAFIETLNNILQIYKDSRTLIKT